MASRTPIAATVTSPATTPTSFPIEARRHGPTMCDVVLFTRSGETVYVAGWLHRDSAHKIAVQLTLALAELRESAGERRQGGAGPDASPQGLAETLID